MTYEQALGYLASLGKFGINLGLARIEKLLDLMQHPERRYRTIHVAGTNGKGSTTAMIASILQASGIKTGMYTSPHLIDYNERMVVDGRPISNFAFAQAIEYVGKYVGDMVAEGWEHPTEFEVLTAVVFYYFAAVGVEFAVIEAGLGGLLDSTNVINPEIAVITNIYLEHTDRCGNTVAEIARHKAGIIKKGVTVVTAAKGEALTVIEQTTAAKTAQIYALGREFHCEAADISHGRQKVDFWVESGAIRQFDVNLLGSHQAENSAVAIMAVHVLAEQDDRITPDGIRLGLERVCWPGRFEVLNGKPVIVIDGAHNPAGAKVLRENLDSIFPERNITFLIGILQDKDMAGITRTLIRPNDNAVVVPIDFARAAQPDLIAQGIKAGNIEVVSSLDDGLERAKNLAGAEGVICATGSLYLIGPVRQKVCK